MVTLMPYVTKQDDAKQRELSTRGGRREQKHRANQQSQQATQRRVLDAAELTQHSLHVSGKRCGHKTERVRRTPGT